MKKIFISTLLILFTVQPLLAQGLVYRNSELNVMMSEKSKAEIDKKNDISKRNYIVTSAVIGTGLGLAVGLVLFKKSNSDIIHDGFEVFFKYTLSGMLIGMLTGTMFGIIDGKSANTNTVLEE